MNVFVDCVEGQSELTFGLISPNERYLQFPFFHSLFHHLPFFLYKALMIIDSNTGGSVTGRTFSRSTPAIKVTF